MLSGSQIVIAPGVHDALTARVAERCGFKAIYMTGGGTVNMQLGVPDHNIITMTEMVSNAMRISNVTSVPLISDADNGYGGIFNVMRTVEEFERAGASAIHIEDQITPKRCGHVGGKKVVSIEEMQGRIRAACYARKDPYFVIIARTDARAPLGFQEAVKRGRAYLEAGADMIFPDALESKEEFRDYVKEVKGMVMANSTQYGKTPIMPAMQYQEIGCKLVIFPTAAMYASLKTVQDLFIEIREKGDHGGFLDRMLTRQQLYDLLDYHEMVELEKKFAEDIGDI
jgi:methylisocitrate lyase